MPPALAAWTALGLLTAASDWAMTRRRLDGKLGDQARSRYLQAAQAVGGTRNLIIIGTALDLLLWPLGLAFTPQRHQLGDREADRLDDASSRTAKAHALSDTSSAAATPRRSRTATATGSTKPASTTATLTGSTAAARGWPR